MNGLSNVWLAGSEVGVREADVAVGAVVSGTRVIVTPGSGASYSEPYSATFPAPSTMAIPAIWQTAVPRKSSIGTDTVPSGLTVGVVVELLARCGVGRVDVDR